MICFVVGVRILRWWLFSLGLFGLCILGLVLLAGVVYTPVSGAGLIDGIGWTDWDLGFHYTP